MFPTTVWTTIRRAGDADRAALDAFARDYRPPVLDYLRRRGLSAEDADDLCQEVFLGLFQGDVLSKADPGRGRFRSLVLTVTVRRMHDLLRRRRPELPVDEALAAPAAEESAFDEAWAWHLTRRALERLRESGSPYHAVLAEHLAGKPQNRNKLWIARGKLAALVRREIALTCTSEEDFEDELAHLARYLGPSREKD